jgi:hypothetical protein
LYIFFNILSSGIRCKWPNQIKLSVFYTQYFHCLECRLFLPIHKPTTGTGINT